MYANKIILAGGSGYIGQCFANYFSKNYEVVVLTRDASHTNNKPTHNSIRFVLWDGKTLAAWQHELEGAFAVINLSGRSVNCRYTEKNKAAIFSSRLDSTRIIGKAINACKQKPGCWINAGSATIYRNSTDKQMTEDDREFHNDFSVQVCKAWEKAFNETETPGVRKAFLRITLVMGKQGGVFKTLHSLTKIGLGGKHGDGNQFVSWIHEQDLCRAVEFILHTPGMQGIVNCAAPHPIRNKDFMALLRKKSGVWFGIPQPRWMLTIGTWIMRTEKELVLKSRNVIPKRLEENGFVFNFPTAEAMLDDFFPSKS